MVHADGKGLAVVAGVPVFLFDLGDKRRCLLLGLHRFQVRDKAGFLHFDLRCAAFV